MGWGSNLKTVLKKYGRVAVGVHLSVSGLCFSGCYVAILNSVDVEGILERTGFHSWLPHPEPPPALPEPSGHVSLPESANSQILGESPQLHTSRPAESSPVQTPSEASGEAGSKGILGTLSSANIAKGGGAFAMAWLCNKALLPVRVPITIGLTPPIWRFLTSKGFRV